MKNGFRSVIVEETIKYSNLWSYFKIFQLYKNVQSKNNNFSKFLIQIGEGDINHFTIPPDWKTNDVCLKIYKDINQNNNYDCVILAPHNDNIIYLNNNILQLLNGKEKTYYSIDYATHKGVNRSDDNIHLNFQIETLNKVKEGFPPHELKLKVNAIVMLIRNLSINDGVCNGTRLEVTKLFEYNTEAEIVIGENIGKKVVIPRITLNTGENLP